MRRPARGGGSRIAQADRKRNVVRKKAVAVKARPSVGVRGRSPRALVGKTVTGRFRVVDGAGRIPRTARIRLFGPFPNKSSATCRSGRVVKTWYKRVTSNGTYRLPMRQIRRPGAYIWGVRVRGNRINLPTSDCGGKVFAKVRPALTVRAPYLKVGSGSRIHAWLKVRNIPRHYRGTARVRLYGPFPRAGAVRCIDRKVHRTGWLKVTAPGGRWTPRLRVGRPGYYGWQVRLPAGPRSTARTTWCRGPRTVVRAR